MYRIKEITLGNGDVRFQVEKQQEDIWLPIGNRHARVEDARLFIQDEKDRLIIKERIVE